MSDGIVTKSYTLRGNSAVAFDALDFAVLYHGPANSSKTLTCCAKLMEYANLYPGFRGLMCRATRAAMTQSVLVTFENKVLPADHPSRGGVGREHRTSYQWPNGSEIVIGGMDNPDRVMSTEYDLIYVAEAHEIDEDGYEKLITRLRNKRVRFADIAANRPDLHVPTSGRALMVVDGRWVPVESEFFHQIIADTNPQHPGHWLWRRHLRGDMRGIRALHGDNPSFGPDDQRALDRLTGHRRRRLRDGEWCAAEGMIFTEFDESLHVVGPEQVPRTNWSMFAIDWGDRAPGVLQVWTFDQEGRAYREVEVYRRSMRQEWWADRVVELHKEYDPVAIVCDTDRGWTIDLLNDRLGKRNGRVIAVPVQKKKIGQRRGFVLDTIDLCAERLQVADDGRPRLFLVRGANRHIDEGLREEGKPWRTEDEIAAFQWRPDDSSRPTREEPDPLCADHGIAAMRYMAAWSLNRWYEEREVPAYRKWSRYSLGRICGHDRILYGVTRPEWQELTWQGPAGGSSSRRARGERS